jgi:hypothetical protein
MLANQIMALRSTRNHILTTSSDLQHLQVGRALALIFDIVTKYQEALMICCEAHLPGIRVLARAASAVRVEDSQLQG